MNAVRDLPSADRSRPAWHKAMDERRAELEKAGVKRDQAYVMALDESQRAAQTEIARLRSLIEDAAHVSEMGHDVARFLREKALGQEYTDAQ